MRNLRNLKHTAFNFGDEALPLSATAWDSSDLICAFGPSATNASICLKRLHSDAFSSKQATAIAIWDAPSPNPELEFDRILSLHFLADAGSICLILEGGDIIIVREDAQPDQDLIEIVGSVDAGISAAAWSPDEELLIIATKANTLLFMTREFDSVASATLSHDDLKISNHVSVGWGNSETQFKGRGAKALRDPTVPEHVDDGTLSPHDDLRTSISWRGDGQFVAINSVLDAQPKRRVIRVFSREGVLDSVSEPVNGLEGALSWKPSGQIVSGIQRHNDGIDVVFFERNGLRHGEFSLRLETDELNNITKPIALLWNTDSSVLAVTIGDKVQLWTMGNYHYYLKQEITLSLGEMAVAPVNWHMEKALQLACFSGDDLRTLSYTLDVSRGSVIAPHDEGIVAVVDGRKLKVTPLRVANVPPPMALEEIELPHNAIDVAINDHGTKIAVLHACTVSLWQCDYKLRPFRPSRLLKTVPLGTKAGSRSTIMRQITFSKTSSTSREFVVVLCSMHEENHSAFIEVDAEDFSVSLGKDIAKSITLFARTDHERICYQDINGIMHQYGDLAASKTDLRKLPTACTAVDLWKREDVEILSGSTASGVLHIHSSLQNLKIPGCTSFAVTSTHLIYTTSSHLLKFVHLHGLELRIPPDEPEQDERCRSIERGARLVTVMPSAFSLVLQMPRGNLETIYPRALVLAGIRQAITRQDYLKAFQICRTQRVDMNILHDYAPAQFMDDIELFIKQIKKVDYIDLFLSSLSDEDVSKTMYKDTILLSADESSLNDGGVIQIDQAAVAGSKINTVCDAFLKALSSRTSSHLQSIVTAHVCKSPPDLNSGLSLVSELRRSGQQEQLEQAVEHICFLADVNQLYDAALGLYDLDVALLVAQQSQKDPREYLPYLQNLQDMQPLRQRFAIDDALKRHTKALSHLHTIGDFEQVKSYTAKHELYTTATELYRYDSARLSEIMRLYADFLSARNRYKEAGIAYEFISDHHAACDAYRSAGLWRECLSTAAIVNLPESRISELAKDLADGLEEAKDFTAAATISLEYLDDLAGAVKLLCRGSQFAEAIRLVVSRRQHALLREVVDPGLTEASATMTEMLANIKSQLNAQVPRLRELRQKKANDPMAFLDGGDAVGDANIPDDISLAPTDASTSGGTFMTRYTNRSMGTLATNATRKTSRNRRREERKRAKGKKGTVYEEEYLVNSIGRLVERVNSIGDEVSRLVEGLMRRTMRERAVAVGSSFQDVLESCQNCMGEVFATNVDLGTLPNRNEDAAGTAPRPEGGQGVLWDAMTASNQPREVPVLRKFERLALLDR